MKRLIKDILRLIFRYITDSDYREYYRLLSKYGSCNRYEELKDAKFLEYQVVAADAPSLISQYKEIFVDEIYSFEADDGRPVIYDCGCNIGSSVIYFKRKYKQARIVAFEADERIANICKRNLVRNRITDVHVVNKAVWIDDNDIEFNVHGADGGSIYGRGNKNRISAVRLRDLLNQEKNIDLLKIDIEGAEYEVILDCEHSLDNVKRIFVEYHSWSDNDQKLSEILGVLEKSGFRYHLESIVPRARPFIDKAIVSTMDEQINIFAKRI